MRLALYTLFVSTALLWSCKPDIKSDVNQSLYDEVMVIHDDVMPKMSDIHKLKKQIRKTYKDDTVEGYKESLVILSQLEKADEGMMTWMANFKIPEGLDAEQQKAYLLKEKLAIKKVSDDMYAAIDTAKTFLK